MPGELVQLNENNNIQNNYVDDCLALVLSNYFELNKTRNRTFIERAKRLSLSNKVSGWIVAHFDEQENVKRFKTNDEETKNENLLQENLEDSENLETKNIKELEDSENSKNNKNNPNTLLGFLMYRNTLLNQTAVTIIYELHVTKSHRNCGIGGRLLTLLLRQLKDAFDEEDEKEEKDSPHGELNKEIGKSEEESKGTTNDVESKTALEIDTDQKESKSLKENLGKSEEEKNSGKSSKENSVECENLEEKNFEEKNSNSNKNIKFIKNSDQLTSSKKVILFVDKANTSAHRFYLRHGFTRMEEYEESAKYYCLGIEVCR